MHGSGLVALRRLRRQLNLIAWYGDILSPYVKTANKLLNKRSSTSNGIPECSPVLAAPSYAHVRRPGDVPAVRELRPRGSAG